MTEFIPGNNEIRLSTEREELITVAHSLVILPDAQEYSLPYTYRNTTSREKAGMLLVRLIGEGKTLAAPREGIFQKAQTQTIRRVLGIRSLNNDDFPSGAWSGGVYLSQIKTTNLDTHEITEKLSIYANGIVSNELGGVSEMSAYKDVTAWSIDLLEPMDSDNLIKANTELEQAAKRYSLR